jgi:hypothetical protein
MAAQAIAEPILWTYRKDRKGLHPIFIRIHWHGARRYEKTGISVDPKYWDEKNKCIKDAHPQAGTLNKSISQQVNEINDKLLKLLIGGKKANADKVKEVVTSKVEESNFFTFVTQRISDTKKNLAVGSVGVYERVLEKLEAFHGSRDLSFEQINKAFIENFEKFLCGRDYALGFIDHTLKIIS